jgi:hypothetical protein
MSDLRKFIFHRQPFFSSYRNKIVYYDCFADMKYNGLHEGLRIPVAELSIVENDLIK